MKPLIFVLLFLTTFASFAQQDRDNKKAAVADMVSHKKLVLFTKSHISEVDKFFSYMLYEGEFFSKSGELELTRIKGGLQTRLFKKSAGTNIKTSSVVITFNTTSADTITNVIISGDFNDVADLFLKYWKPNLKFNKTKQEYVIAGHDKVLFTSNVNDKAKLEISNYQGNNLLNK